MSKPIEYIIFTDASLRRKGGRSYCGYGVVILNVRTREYIEFGEELGDHTIAYGEAWAIYKGVQKCIDYVKGTKNDPTPVLVVTDSKLNVAILTEYIPRCWDLSDWNNWKKVDGTPVKNQKVYRKLWTMITKNPQVHVRITHVNSHLKDRDWKRIKKKLEKYGVMVKRDTATMFIAMNGKADYIAQGITMKMRKEEEKHGEFLRLKRKFDE